MEQLHYYIEMRECEHTRSGCLKIQARAMHPSNYLGGIQADGLWGTLPSDPRPAVCGKALRDTSRCPLSTWDPLL